MSMLNPDWNGYICLGLKVEDSLRAILLGSSSLAVTWVSVAQKKLGVPWWMKALSRARGLHQEER